jgi:adenine deaminase
MSKGLLIQGGKIVNADRTFNADIYCEGGVIKRIAPVIERESVGTDVRVIDAHGKIIVPGKYQQIQRNIEVGLKNKNSNIINNNTIC